MGNGCISIRVVYRRITLIDTHMKLLRRLFGNGNIYRVITWGGLGDVMLSTPTFAALKRRNPGCRIIVYCLSKNHAYILKNNPDIDHVRSISAIRNPLSYLLYRFKLAHFYRGNYGHTHPSLFYKKSATEIVAEIFEVELKSRRIRIFFTEKERLEARERMAGYTNPIILHISSRTSGNQEWPLSNWGDVVKSMPGYTFIQLGVISEAKVEGVVDLRGKTSIRQAMALIEHCISFVGVNSSLSHVTNVFGIPGVVLFGPSNPEIWGHDNNINIYKEWRCAPCIDLLLSSKCPYARPCMAAITVEDVKNALAYQVNQKEYKQSFDLCENQYK
jgi:ADP-heptose:LPS heptosyltransferase